MRLIILSYLQSWNTCKLVRSGCSEGKKETGVEDKLFDLVWRTNVPELSCVFFPVQTITFEIKTFIYTAH